MDGTKRYRLMLVDDNSEMLEELGEILEAAGYEVTTAHDSGTVLEKASKDRPDLIIMDLKMSPKSGFQLAEELKHIDETADIPIIAISGYFTEKEHRLLWDICGIREQINKPFNPLDIIAAVERGLNEGKTPDTPKEDKDAHKKSA